MCVAARSVLVREVEVEVCRPQGRKRAPVYKAHERGQGGRGKGGKSGGEGGAKGGEWVEGGLESSLAPRMAGRHAVTRPPSP